MKNKNTIELSWSIGDVREVRPDLNVEQCRAVLGKVAGTHDATIGVNWDTLMLFADDLFGPEREDIPAEEVEILDKEFAAALSEKPAEIIITLEGGLVQSVDNIPDGIRVKVLDFDIEGTTEQEIIDHGTGEFYRNEDGQLAEVYQF